VNEKGPGELRLAHAERDNGNWVLTLVQEPPNMTPDNVPSRVEFQKLARKCCDMNTHCLFYVHGYNKPFAETLDQGWLLQERYGVEVVLFSWPSNTGGIVTSEYREARRIAQASFGALDALFEKFGNYLLEMQTPLNEAALLKCGVTINLMTHSLGSYLLEHYVLSSAYQQETRMFTNVVLSQADVNNLDHPKWVDHIILTGRRVYVTINENDKILQWAETVNPPRLGKTLANLVSPRASYFDFTRGKHVNNKHQLWGEVNNPLVGQFFKGVLNGERGEDIGGFTYDSQVNAFRIS
jgi:hypothetical protein